MIGHVLPRFWSVGARVTELGSALLTHRSGLATEPTATFLHDVRASDVDALDAVLSQASEITGTPCSRIYLHSGSSPRIEAELVWRDWHVEPNLQLLLPADHAGPAHTAEASVRPATESDWDELSALFRADHEEEDRKFGRPIRSQDRTAQLVQARRVLPLPVRYFVADEGDAIAGFVAGWPGDTGIGLVEDLFVRTDHRGRGLTTALIAQAVGWARTGGAGPVAIGAEPADTPKRLYARLGFTPTDVLRVASPGVVPAAPLGESRERSVRRLIEQ